MGLGYSYWLTHVMSNLYWHWTSLSMRAKAAKPAPQPVKPMMPLAPAVSTDLKPAVAVPPKVATTIEDEEDYLDDLDDEDEEDWDDIDGSNLEVDAPTERMAKRRPGATPLGRKLSALERTLGSMKTSSRQHDQKRRSPQAAVRPARPLQPVAI
jgi:hypothetical protein